MQNSYKSGPIILWAFILSDGVNDVFLYPDFELVLVAGTASNRVPLLAKVEMPLD